MQHLTGNVSQAVRHDYGEFITVGNFRFRKELLTAYHLVGVTDDPEGREFGMRALIDHGWVGIAVGTREEAQQAIERLDWIYSKGDRNEA